ncbi:MAG: methyltransferase domain-containing protein [Deltaproteobacteria bacterium]|nr:methyltransferase domain-containing protein [Deltaproteobacteria bacterium]
MSAVHDFLLFLKEFAKNPMRVGSVAPSGVQLARRMVHAADIHPDHVVVELGAGTGPVTRELRAAHPEVPLLVLEPSPQMAALLRQAHPDITVVEEFAQDLPEILRKWGHERADRVVSSLPWTMWSEEVIRSGLDAVVEGLVPTGRMVTFSYVHSQTLLPASRRFRSLLNERFGRVDRTRIQWRNLPPALVFVCGEPATTSPRTGR